MDKNQNSEKADLTNGFIQAVKNNYIESHEFKIRMSYKNKCRIFKELITDYKKRIKNVINDANEASITEKNKKEYEKISKRKRQIRSFKRQFNKIFLKLKKKCELIKKEENNEKKAKLKKEKAKIEDKFFQLKYKIYFARRVLRSIGNDEKNQIDDSSDKLNSE